MTWKALVRGIWGLRGGGWGLKGLGGQVLKPELDAAVFGGECFAFPLGGSAYMIIGDLVENNPNLSFLHVVD